MHLTQADLLFSSEQLELLHAGVTLPLDLPLLKGRPGQRPQATLHLVVMYQAGTLAEGE